MAGGRLFHCIRKSRHSPRPQIYLGLVPGLSSTLLPSSSPSLSSSYMACPSNSQPSTLRSPLRPSRLSRPLPSRIKPVSCRSKHILCMYISELILPIPDLSICKTCSESRRVLIPIRIVILLGLSPRRCNADSGMSIGPSVQTRRHALRSLLSPLWSKSLIWSTFVSHTLAASMTMTRYVCTTPKSNPDSQDLSQK